MHNNVVLCDQTFRMLLTSRYNLLVKLNLWFHTIHGWTPGCVAREVALLKHQHNMCSAAWR